MFLNGAGTRVTCAYTRFGGKEEANMNYVIDDIARILAGSTPRRKALKLIGGVLAGGLFGAAFGQASGNCTGDRFPNPQCSPNQQCCGQFCVGLGIGNPPASPPCCPNTFVCPPTRCCVVNNTQGCCPPGTCFNVQLGTGSCVSVNGATPTACTTDTSQCA